jgi:hypothetical protein
MRNRLAYATVSLAAVLALSPVQAGQTAKPQATTKTQAATKALAAPVPKRDLSGVWQYQGSGSAEGIAPEKDIPAMTHWGQARFDAERPGYGSRAVPDGNDPILQCDPAGFPRVMFMPTPFEFVQARGRVVQFFEREHEWRPIWTDGRSLPKDADLTWYGYAIGHWEGDYTLVIQSSGFNDKTWLGSGGYPHSDDMRVTERYQRVDHDTILYNITVDDPKAYTKPIVAPQKTMKLRPKAEIEELVCVWSEENAFSKRIREPASAKNSK